MPDKVYHDNSDHPGKNNYYQAICNNCGWTGCSCQCGEDPGITGDTDVYCPQCNSADTDSINN